MAPTFSMAYFSKSPKNLGDMMSILNVLMSIQLPFAVIPMLTFTSSRYVVQLRKVFLCHFVGEGGARKWTHLVIMCAAPPVSSFCAW